MRSLSLSPSLPPGRSARLSPHVRFIKGEESGEESGDETTLLPSLPPSLPPSLSLSLSLSPSPLSLPPSPSPPPSPPPPLSALSHQPNGPRRAALSQHSDSTTGVWTMTVATGVRETRRQGRGRLGGRGEGDSAAGARETR